MAARFAEATGPNGAVVAFDINPIVLANARQYVQSTPVAERVTFQEGDVLKAPYEQATFDLTWCSFAIHHMPDPVAAAREMQRVTKPGGRVVLRLQRNRAAAGEGVVDWRWVAIGMFQDLIARLTQHMLVI